MIPGCPCPHAGTPDRAANEDDQLTVVLRSPQAGSGAGLSHRDKIAVAVELTARKKSARVIAGVLGVDPRTVHRWRSAARTTTEV
jgi:transposase-like protein